MKELTKQDIDVILYLDNVSDTEKFIEALEEKTDYNIIVVDIICNEETKKLSNRYSGNNIIFLELKDANKCRAYNEALKICKSNYVTFTIPNISYVGEAFNQVIEVIRENCDNSIITLTPTYNNKRYVAFKNLDKNKQTLIDLKSHSQAFILYIYGYFFKRDFISKFKFDENLSCDGTIKFLLEVLSIEQKYLLLKSTYKYNLPIESEYYSFKEQFFKEWYVNSMKEFICSFTQKDSPLFVKYAIAYIIQCRFACNIDGRDKAILSQEEKNDFFKDTSLALKNIDDYIICNNKISGRKTIPKYLTLNLLRLKYENQNLFPKIVTSGGNMIAYINDAIVENLENEKLEIQVIYFDGNNLTMDGIFRGAYLFNNDLEIVCRINENEYKIRRTDTYSINKVFNIATRKSYTFHFSIPSESLNHNDRISFYVKYNNNYYPLKIVFKRAQSKLSSEFKNSYWRFDNKILFYSEKEIAFRVQKSRKKRLLKKEISLLKEFIKKGNKSIKWKNIFLRLVYWISKPFFRKKIWITSDKIFKAGDNGEYMYNYIKKINPKDIKIYYIINKNSCDYRRLKKKYDTILTFNSFKAKLVSLHSNMILATHVDVMNCCGFDKNNQQYFKDLFNPKIACIAHGLTIQKIAQYQNRVFDNTTLYFFASKYEIENVKHPEYDYYDEDILKLTGHARYDGLINNEQKQILITPTWRKGTTVGSTIKGSSYTHSDTFKGSAYFNIYNQLINDKNLIECARRNGYKIIYLLHPAMSSQIDDFDKNDYVEIIAATSNMSYEKILTESSIMITDYSGVQFDFAYMKKPIIYYHPTELPAQYEEGGLKYDTMGFGPICKENDEVVSEICKYINKNCKMEEIYQKRVDDFFEYNDHNNCKRTYEELIKYK